MKIKIPMLIIAVFAVSKLYGQISDNCVINTLLSGFSERSYTSEPVTDQQLDLILKCGIKTPSARNNQPWKFTVIKDEATMKEIINNVVPGNILIIVSGIESKEGATPDFDCGLATESMFVAAHSLGLGARIYGSPTGDINSKKELFEIPSGYKAVVVLRIGNMDKDVDAVSAATPRKKPEEVTNYKSSITSSALYGAPDSKKHLGIATYSVKGLESNIEGSLKALSDDSYVVMEISNYNANTGLVAGYKPADYAALAKKYGLEIISSHARAKFDVKDVEGTLAAWGKVFDDHKTMGCKYVVFPMNIWAGTVEGVKAECDLMNKVGDEANKRGIKFGYHNHHIEFVPIAGTDQLYEDFLIANTDPDKVFFQMDVYWVTQGGQDPVAYLKKYPKRFKVLHIKDDYVVGESGKINYEAIFKQFYKNGYEDWFVEMEDKMTPEQREQSKAMMDGMKNIQTKGGSMNDFMAEMMKNQPKDKDGKPIPPAGFGGPKDPKEVAEQLKTSLEGIKQSADFLLKSDFVK